MTLAACGVIEWPRSEIVANTVASGGGAGSATLDSTTDMVSIVCTSPITDSIAVIYFRTGVIPAGGGDDVDVRIETVANGRPTGTLWNTNTNVVVTIADSDDNVWKTATLTAAASITIGAEFAIVIRSSAGTPNIVLSLCNGSQLNVGIYPVYVWNTTGSDAVVPSTAHYEWIVQWTNAGIRYLPGLSPTNGGMTLSAFKSDDSPDEYALRFVPPFKCRVIGARLMIGNIATAGSFIVSLWDSTGDTDAEALAQTVTIDSDFPSANTVDGLCEFMFDTQVTLTAGSTYYLGLRAESTTLITLFTAPTGGTGAPANAIKCFASMSTNEYLATRTWTAGTAGAWSDTTGTYPFIQLLIDQLDDGAGGSGGNANILGGSTVR